MEQKKTPFFIIALGWLISLSAFALGFWHTHHGLIPMKPLGTEYGSFVVAGLILAVLIVAYNRAVSGVKIALLFYFICASFNFTFNMNSFYPTLLGRKLIKEETIALNDTLQNYSARLQKEQAALKKDDFGVVDNTLMKRLQDLEQIKQNLLREIVTRGGFGPFAKQELAKFNLLTNSKITPDRELGKSEAQKQSIKEYYEKQLNEGINNFRINNLTQGDKTAMAIVMASGKMDTVRMAYESQLKAIINDNSEIKIDSSTKNHPQIKILQNLVTDIDNIINTLNKSTSRQVLKPLNDETEGRSAVPHSQYLGQFDNTLESVAHRIKRTDTWGVIILVTFIDFIVPLAIYFLIRGGNADTQALTNKVLKRKKPSTF